MNFKAVHQLIMGPRQAGSALMHTLLFVEEVEMRLLKNNLTSCAACK